MAARAAIAPSLAGNRDLLYLDLALEDTARRAAEAAAGAARGGRAAAALVGPLLANLALSLGDNEDVCRALKAWEDAPKAATTGFVGGGNNAPPPLSEDDALRAAAAADRARRAVARAADAVHARIGDKADALGGALGVEPWARDLFVEEVVRGGPAFGASLALSAAEPALRAAASLEPWQVVSPGSAVGVLRLADSLHELAYDDLSAAEEGGAPVVLLVARVSGEEEPPTGAAAVLTGAFALSFSFLFLRIFSLFIFRRKAHFFFLFPFFFGNLPPPPQKKKKKKATPRTRSRTSPCAPGTSASSSRRAGSKLPWTPSASSRGKSLRCQRRPREGWHGGRRRGRSCRRRKGLQVQVEALLLLLPLPPRRNRLLLLLRPRPRAWPLLRRPRLLPRAERGARSPPFSAAQPPSAPLLLLLPPPLLLRR